MPCEVRTRVLLLYGSQRGQAQSIAEEICDQAGDRGFVADICCLSQTERYNLENETSLVVIVVSTTGDGDPPDTALKFVKRIKTKTLPSDHFAHLRYALLALGDTNYANFCNCGKTIDKRLQELGANHFYATGHADDGVGLEIVVDPWIEGLWAAIKSASSEMSTPHRERPDPEQAVHPGGPGSADEQNGEKVAGDLNLHLLKLGDSSELSRLGPPAEKAAVTVNAKEASLAVSLPPVSTATLNVPTLPPPYLNVKWLDAAAEQINVPFISETFYEVPVSRAVQLTREDALKTSLLVELDILGQPLSYQPGDSFDVLCSNQEVEVEELLQRLGMAGQKNLCIQLQLRGDTTKKAAKLPSHVPEKCTLLYLLTWCLEIRSVPKKAFLRALADCTPDATERRRLLELCSKQGAADYNRFVRDPGLCVVELLRAFPTCSPPLSLLIEHLPRLQPRSYSAASSCLRHPGKLHFVFNIVKFPASPERPLGRRGLCTGWLSDLVSPILQPHDGAQAPPENTGPLTLPKVFISTRPSSSFHLPADPAVPFVMVGPGTGVAPFIGFLQHREQQRQESSDRTFGETWLFFGCRHKDREFLFREDLERYVQNGTLTHLKVSFSRDSPEGAGSGPKYVQHNLHLNAQHVANILLKQNGCFYVCGDAKNMARDVNEALVEIVGKELQVDKLEAMKTVARLRDERRYQQDIWS